MQTQISRPRGARRMRVPITHAITYDETCAAFIALHQYAPSIPRGPHLPTTSVLLFRIEQILWLEGCRALESRPAEDDLVAYAGACAKKIWNSRLVVPPATPKKKARPGKSAPSEPPMGR